MEVDYKQRASLYSWMNKINGFKIVFTNLQILHVYREFNVEAYVLSKQTLSLNEGKNYVVEFLNDAKV